MVAAPGGTGWIDKATVHEALAELEAEANEDAAVMKLAEKKIKEILEQ